MKILTILIMVMFLMVGTAQAKGFIDTFIEERIVKTGIVYDITDKETRTVFGIILVGDFYLDDLDLDLFLDGDKAVILGLDYTLKAGDDIEPYIGIGLGLDRIESVDSSDEWGEYFPTINAGVRFKF